MAENLIFSIGHGNRNMEEFMIILKNFDIEYLIDVRSLPFSKFNPQYNQNELQFTLERNRIKYVFMGENLGGRPKR